MAGVVNLTRKYFVLFVLLSLFAFLQTHVIVNWFRVDRSFGIVNYALTAVLLRPNLA